MNYLQLRKSNFEYHFTVFKNHITYVEVKIIQIYVYVSVFIFLQPSSDMFESFFTSFIYIISHKRESWMEILVIILRKQSRT